LKPPDSARLRAYKFSHAVFDMTLTPDGLWLLGPWEHPRPIILRRHAVGTTHSGMAASDDAIL